ncbi:hypothetical protein ABIA69_001938 [Lysinibacillus parviboronicapiens]|uniref:Uncharacterized protein n=1 Tax=Lysinibacillus parviboronicapiens TaxID=436516 RepID=A0ABV2PJH5_9BACI
MEDNKKTSQVAGTTSEGAKIRANINTKFVICADEDFKKILAEFLDVIQQESRMQVEELNVEIEMSKNYYVDRNNIPC